MSKNKEKSYGPNLTNFDEEEEKNPLAMLGWFTKDKLDKKAYWTFLLILFLFYVITNISIFFRA